MAKVFIEETTLTAIGNAIREKEGSSELVPVNDMATRISAISGGGGGGELEPIVLTGDCSYACSGQLTEAIISSYPDKISTRNLTMLYNMFYYTKLKEIPFDLNLNKATKFHNLFYYADKLEVCPRIRGTIDCTNTSLTFNSILESAARLRDIEDLFTGEMLEDLVTAKVTSAYSCVTANGMFTSMYSLRHLPSWFYKFKLNPESTAFPSSSKTIYYSGFKNCYALDEVLNLPVLTCQAAQTSNMMNGTFTSVSHVNRITFETNPDGTPIVAQWKAQTIDLTTAGYQNNNVANFVNYNSGITSATRVSDAETYQALKNDPDWHTAYQQYSRYDHNSAVETINSLPDTSAYLATAGGTNTIKFKRDAGSATDGGAINTLTAEEIAVATAKGWTVTLA